MSDLNLNDEFWIGSGVTEYEVGILNFLYLVDNAYQISSLKTYNIQYYNAGN